MHFVLKYLFFFCVYFLIHYLEGLPPIGVFSFAQFWKIPLLLYLLYYSLKYIGKRPLFEKAGFFYAIEQFFSKEIMINPLSVFIGATKSLPIILFFRYWVGRFSRRLPLLETLLYSVAQYVCLSSLPVLLGIIRPLREMVSASSFGIEGKVYFSGVFGAPHAASSYFCIAVLILLNGFLIGRFRSKFSKVYNALLIMIGLVSIFEAYVRTGWLMLLLGSVVLLKKSRPTVRQVFFSVVIIFVVIGGLLYLYSENEAFRARLTGVNVYTGAGGENLDTSGSGRIAFWITGIQNWADNSLYGLLFGSGVSEVMEMNYSKTGLRVISHNQFVDSLAQNGLLGLLLLLLFYGGLYGFIKRIPTESPYKRLAYAVALASIVFAFFQNEIYFDFAFLFSLVLAIAFLPSSNVLDSQSAN